MKTLRERFGRYTGMLREFKLAYTLHSWLNRDKLEHNKSLYPEYGLRKSRFAPLGKSDFPDTHPDIPWLDRPDALDRLTTDPVFKQMDAQQQAGIRQFVEQGYLILPAFFAAEQVDRLNGEIDGLLRDQTLQFNYSGRKVMDAFRYAPAADDFFRDPRLLALLDFMMGKKVVPFQTINFLRGSEQRAHADSIHMTTFPEGYLIAAWIALEDIQPGTGELFYYPGSHRLPFISTQDYPSGNTRWRLGPYSNRMYEDKMEEVLAGSGLKKQTFLAKKGDVLLWHSNLLHGGSPLLDPESTRRSMVAHYYCEGVICYHEMTQRPALLEYRP
jgi:hypothetical protein